MTITDVARVCHEANGSLCASQGDFSQTSWDEAPDWQKESAIKGVEFALKNPDATPADQHESWSAQKIADGWVYGPVKDAEKKTHHCLVPYSELPPEQQQKDYLFRAIVHAFAPFIEGNSNSVSAIADGLTDKQRRFVALDKRKTEIKQFSEDYKAAVKDVVDEIGVGGYFQDSEGVVYMTNEPDGKFVYFEKYDILRTRREGEKAGSLSLTAARDAGFTVEGK
jgi:hypothetical protein